MKLTYFLLLFLPLGVCAQTFTPTTKPDFVGVGNSTCLSFDADNDGKPDVFLMGKTGASFYSKLYHNNGDSTFLDLGIAFPALAYGDASLIDFNNDGRMDILLCGFDGTNRRFCLFKNKGNNSFSEVPLTIPGVDYSCVKCADVNNDGWMDIIVCGQTAVNMIFKIYKNNGNGNFTEASTLEGIYDGSFEVTDINHDGYPDIIASGVNKAFELVSKVYMNTTQNFVFSERTSNITPLRGGKISVLDFNSDGYADVLITGKSSNDQYKSEVYKNNSGETFTLFASLKGLYYAASAVGDFNNDGLSDIISCGLDAGALYKTVYYQNSGAGFTEQATTFPDVIKGSIFPLDLMGSGRLDVLISGYAMAGPVTIIYKNDLALQNTAPGAPVSLSAINNNDSVILSWRRPQDTRTASKALTYDFYIKRVLDGDTIFTAPSGYLTGQRYVTRQGQLQDTFLVIRNLPYGKYTWSVQSVDQGYEGSAFAPEGTFNICHNLNIGRDTSICFGSNFNLWAGNVTDVVDWYTAQDPLVSFYRGNAATVNVVKNTTVWAVVNTTIGCQLSDTMSLSVLPLPQTIMKGDTGVCVHSDLTLSLAKQDYKGDWSSAVASGFATGTPTFSFQVMHSDTMYVKISDTNGCINFDTMRVKALDLPLSFLPSDTASCFKTTLQFKAGSATDSVYWFNSNGELLLKEQTLNYTVVQTANLSVKLISTLKCINFDTLTVKMLPLPIAQAGKDTLICPGASVSLGVITQAGTYQYDWTPTQSLDDSHVAQPTATPLSSTDYRMKITDTNKCINYDTVKIRINAPSVINAGGDKAICIGSSVLLGGSPTASGSILPYHYEWFPVIGLSDPGSTNPTAHPDTSTQYHLVVFAGDCIVDTTVVKVTVLSLPVITKSDDRTIGYQESAQLRADGGSQYSWAPETGLDNTLISNPVASPEVSTQYTVLVTDNNGCESTAQVTITVRNELFVPNLFTPNGDGKNDYFRVYGTGIAKIHLQVFTPEGIQVYETTDVQEATSAGWDGTFHGNLLGAGKYLWVADVTGTDNKPLLYNGSNKGVITLLR